MRRTLSVSEDHHAVSPPAWTPMMIAEARGRLRALQAADQARQAREAALNDLEGYIYKVINCLRIVFFICCSVALSHCLPYYRIAFTYVHQVKNRLSDEEEELKKVSTEEQRQDVLTLSSTTEGTRC